MPDFRGGSSVTGRRPSHQVTMDGDRVIVHDLELFAGYDPDIDDPGDKRIKKFDADRIRDVVKYTVAMMDRGQNPKLIVGHNSEMNPDIEQPVVGDIVAVREREIGKAAGIVGDVEMSAADFDAYMKSNKYPRRSAEIWLDKQGLTEVALLQSRTPARPLPDTRFSKVLSGEIGGCEKFSRQYAPLAFANPTRDMHGPGPGNTDIPSQTKRKERDDMPCDDDKKEPMKNMGDDEKDKMIAKLKAEVEDLKGKIAQSSKSSKDAEDQAEKFARRLKDSEDTVATLRADLTREQFGRRLDAKVAEGMRLPSEQRAKVMDRIVAAKDPEAEFTFFAETLPRDPRGPVVHPGDLRLSGTTGSVTAEQEEEAARVAMKRAEGEKPGVRSEKFRQFMHEELEKITGQAS